MENLAVEEVVLDVDLVKDVFRLVQENLPEDAHIVSLVIGSPEAAFECKQSQSGFVILVSNRFKFDSNEE